MTEATAPRRERHPPPPLAARAGARDYRRGAFVGLAAAYLIIVLVVWLAPTPPDGWAVGDALDYHFPVINYFIQHGFDLHYPPGLIAMFPGMHMFFAAVARLFGLHSMAFTSLPAFLIQSLFGLALLGALYRVALSTAAGPAAAVVAALPALSSSFVLYSWVWPTTDLGSLAFYAWMLATLIAAPLPTATSSAAQSLLTAGSIFFRQSYAVLGLATLASALVRGASGSGERPDRRAVALALLPIAVAAACVCVLIACWGNIVPPGFERHSAGGFNPVSGVHVLALSGLIAWPFALPFVRRPGSAEFLRVGLAALALALLCCLTLPLDFSRQEGRYNSLVWNLPRVFLPHHGIAFVGILIAVGSFLWISLLTEAWKARRFAPELILFALFTASLAIQKMAWERYVEPELLLTLGVYFARRGLSRGEAALAIAAYGAFGLVTVAHAFGSSGTFKM